MAFESLRRPTATHVDPDSRQNCTAGGGSQCPSAGEEVLRHLLRLAGPGNRAPVAPTKLLDAFGSLRATLSADVESLCCYMDAHTAGRLNLLWESYLYMLREEIEQKPLIGSWGTLVTYLRIRLGHQTTEKLLVLFLDAKNYLIREEVIQEGTLDHVSVYPREIAKRALQLNASAMILVHNHPSGDAAPSQADVETSRKLVAALSPLGVVVHDHAIVGNREVTSLRAKRLL